MEESKADVVASTSLEKVTLPVQVREGVVLRGFKREDEAFVQKAGNNPEVAKNLRDRFPSPYTADDAKQWIDFMMSCKAPLHHVAIEVDGVYAGGMSVEMHEDVHRKTGEIGYWLGQEFWGKGVMTAALRVFVRYCFTNFDLLRLEAPAFARNKASARVLEKGGFTYEGRLRQSVIKNGVVLDQVMYSMLPSEAAALVAK